MEQEAVVGEVAEMEVVGLVAEVKVEVAGGGEGWGGDGGRMGVEQEAVMVEASLEGDLAVVVRVAVPCGVEGKMEEVPTVAVTPPRRQGWWRW